MKTKEELLRPRFKVIADYPGTDFTIGELVYTDEFMDSLTYNDEGRVRIAMKDYSHLFKKLEWWEEREKDDMPQYVELINKEMLKTVTSGFYSKYYKVESWQFFNDGEVYWACALTDTRLRAHYFIPATEQEYNEYIKSKE